MHDPTPKVLLVGAGTMAREYAKVLKAMHIPFLTVGHSLSGTTLFKKETGRDAVAGGIESWLKENEPPAHAIVAVNEEKLGAVTRFLLTTGVKTMLVEKPAGLSKKDLLQTTRLAQKERAAVFVAYNRRFYASVQKALELIQKDSGPLSFTFDFTEWEHRVRASKQPAWIKKRWLIVNSSHVIDLAFFLGGKPRELSALVAGSLKWHPHAAIYSGSGATHTGVPFSYHANWLSAGRWGIEIMTKNHRFICRPLEQLAYIKKDSFAIEEYPIDDALDKKFKPGLYRQVRAFLKRDKRHLATIEEQLSRFEIYAAIEAGRRRYFSISKRKSASR